MEQPGIFIRNLAVTFTSRDPSIPGGRAVRNVSIAIEPGKVHALVGESGSGKSVTARTVLGIVGADARVEIQGSIDFRGRNLLELSDDELRSIRGKEIAMIFQEPSRYLNPSITIGVQIGEVLEAHFGLSRRASLERVGEMLSAVELPSRVARRYPHELSGGMKQRAMIAMALVCNPSFVLADEPTTSLDVTVQKQILELLARLQADSRMGMLFISHDLAVVQSIADHVSVMYAGRIVESAPRDELFANPLHPYTRQLLLSVPRSERRGLPLTVIPGRAPDAQNIPEGCAFHPRCRYAVDVCRREMPAELVYGPSHSASCHMIGKLNGDSE
ncbi:MAG TPA: ABC transporter ATP-binding protein [Spirochaetia bacterium]|nr:ABC transporter ATP-binding protein [Spirochaetia bacterium]